MALAVVSDIHANLPALQAVLEDLKDQDVEDVVCLGDVVGFGPHANEVVALLRKRAVPCLMGNHEQAVLDQGPKDAPERVTATAAWTRARLEPTHLEWMRRLPVERRLVLHKKGYLLTHAAPGNLWKGIDLDAPAEVLAGLSRQVAANVLVVGHTHHLGVRDTAYGAVANPGSVGLSFDGPEATYLVFEGRDIIARHVPYDVDAFVGDLEKDGQGLQALPPEAARHLGG